MWQWSRINWGRAGGAILLFSLLIYPWGPQALAAQQTSLSRWLTHDAGAALEQLLAQHPRYAGQAVLLQPAANGLEEAIITVLRMRLSQSEHIVLLESQVRQPMVSTPRSIDALDCLREQRGDYRLVVSAGQGSGGRDTVTILLMEQSTGEAARRWDWSGDFSRDEKRYLRKAASAMAPDGSLEAPWSGGDVEAAALSLSRELGCALRPQVASRLAVAWPAQAGLPDLFSDTSNASRHLVGSYREISLVADEADFSIDVRLERFRDDLWQLWLVGTPRKSALAPVQAVAYFRHEVSGRPRPERVTTVEAAPVPAVDGEPLEFLEVRLLDATQSDRGSARADLQVTLKIVNRAEWPIAYSFTLSGGHFNHCIANPAYYRHDHYGRLAGSVPAGTSEVHRLTIENARHRPAPLFGVRKCAGFRDLDGFEAFARQGHKVTDFVRWDM